MWSKPTCKNGRRRAGQIGTVQIYRRAAQLADAEYRDLLSQVCGATSSTDRGLTNRDFDACMAHLEAKLEYRVREGFVPEPDSRKIRSLTYWRRRYARIAAGGMNSRQRHRLTERWDALRPYLPEPDRTIAYLAGIAERAGGVRVRSIWEAPTWVAALTIEALKDRLKYALREAS